jgi:hypothetical protein
MPKDALTPRFEARTYSRALGSLFRRPLWPARLADVNTLIFNGQGAVTGTGMVSQNGNIVPVTETGVYNVNPDCTGTYAVLLSPFGFTAHYYFAIDAGGELQIICTDSGVAFSGTARRQ